jgi:hypothetical protein
MYRFTRGRWIGILKKKCSCLSHLTEWRLLTRIDTMPRVLMHQVGSQTEGDWDFNLRRPQGNNL